ncbi:unnamed protein product, partial [Ceratitis capitata]
MCGLPTDAYKWKIDYCYITAQIISFSRNHLMSCAMRRFDFGSVFFPIGKSKSNAKAAILAAAAAKPMQQGWPRCQGYRGQCQSRALAWLVR